jgi:hypothetical protein
MVLSPFLFSLTATFPCGWIDIGNLLIIDSRSPELLTRMEGHLAPEAQVALAGTA